MAPRETVFPALLASRDELNAALALRNADSADGASAFPCIDPEAFTPYQSSPAVSTGLMRRLRFMPLYRTTGGLVVALEKPEDPDLVQQVRFIMQRRVIPVRAPADSLRRVLAAAPEPQPPREEIACVEFSPATDEPAGEPGAAIIGPSLPAFRIAPEEETDADETTAVQLFNSVVMEAYQSGVSDIHLEPRSTGALHVRYRCDGELRDSRVIPSRLRAAVVSRIKIMAALDISERRKAQDGKIDFSWIGGVDLELRVATIPLANGLEGVVIRLLTSEKALPTESLGLPPDTLRSLRESVERPHGLILVCGPTGSGKTTTLHSLLNHLNTGDRKIWTAEDPIEITQEGLCQVQVNPKIGWTFAAALRAFLRADPDVIMVGEMRDRETASIAVEASLTGHMVMSTLHTSGAPDAAVRLLDMGLDPFSLSDALIGVLAQRLVRRVCTDCVEFRPATDLEVELYERELRDAGADADAQSESRSGWRIALPRGCKSCAQTGYKGRVGLYEWMPLSADLRNELQRRAGAEDIRTRAVAEGMRTLRQDGIKKALEGETTLDQVRAVCGGAAPARKFGRRSEDFSSRTAAG
jgi:type II secretory ATPase GspE/PulE/Tfp pilus assembly ATPase PilB-like protein